MKILKIDKECKKEWSKIINVKTFRECDLPSVTFFILEDFDAKNKLFHDEVFLDVDEDLKIICQYPIVIRTSLKNEKSNYQGLYLPRTNTIFEWTAAKNQKSK